MKISRRKLAAFAAALLIGHVFAYGRSLPPAPVKFKAEQPCKATNMLACDESDNGCSIACKKDPISGSYKHAPVFGYYKCGTPCNNGTCNYRHYPTTNCSGLPDNHYNETVEVCQ